ncbi:MAG: PhnD/SsuA/transferrin family substrate-binding protein [Verrucomicrobia bacterium]|nr:PhnD/SsuA/transferrin family substrate-binding protein [Verrucomicrobiota bacterium]
MLSMRFFQEVNQNDAQAALKVWLQNIASERGVAMNPFGKIVDGAPAMREVLRDREADLVGLAIDEFDALHSAFRYTHLYVIVAGGRVEEDYVLVTHREGGRARLADLEGASLLVYSGPQMALAEPWLDLELVRNHLLPGRQHFRSQQMHSKLTKAVLPVFFRQAEAALVSRRGFETMIELNPQLGRQLRVIAQSPPVIPMVVALAAGMDPIVRAQVAANVTEIHKAPGGRQVLNLLQGERLEEITAARLAPSLALLAEHRRLRATLSP